MNNTTKKVYVIRKGKKIGIFNSWDECKNYVIGYSDAKYKSFDNLDIAEKALNEGREKYYDINKTKTKQINTSDIPFYTESIAVDAACAGNPGYMEYRGIDLYNGKEIFHERFENGTNNIGEFLAIILGLKYLEYNPEISIYSDSKIAISRVNQGICKTQAHIDKKLHDTIKEYEVRLKQHGINNKILKWNTEERGEIPADFGRK